MDWKEKYKKKAALKEKELKVKREKSHAESYARLKEIALMNTIMIDVAKEFAAEIGAKVSSEKENVILYPKHGYPVKINFDSLGSVYISTSGYFENFRIKNLSKKKIIKELKKAFGQYLEKY